MNRRSFVKTGAAMAALGTAVPPLDVRSSVMQVFIDGEAVPMVSRQTQLRDQYMPLTEKKN
jgi:hypothetical protein